MVSCPFDVWINVGDQEVMSFLLNYSIPLDVAPTIIDGNTLVPVRAISEASGYNVNWNANDRIISITSLQYTQASYDDVTNEITQINNYIDNGLYLEAVNLCDIVKATFNLSDEDKNLVDNLKTTAQTKYNTYINETQKNNYYSNTNIQTYTSVTGYDCIQSHDSDNTVIYTYPYDIDGVSMYIDYLINNGWQLWDEKTSDDSYTLYYSKSYNLIGVSIQFKFNEVWIVIGK